MERLGRYLFEYDITIVANRGYEIGKMKQIMIDVHVLFVFITFSFTYDSDSRSISNRDNLERALYFNNDILVSLFIFNIQMNIFLLKIFFMHAFRTTRVFH